MLASDLPHVLVEELTSPIQAVLPKLKPTERVIYENFISAMKTKNHVVSLIKGSQHGGIIGTFHYLGNFYFYTIERNADNSLKSMFSKNGSIIKDIRVLFLLNLIIGVLNINKLIYSL